MKATGVLLIICVVLLCAACIVCLLLFLKIKETERQNIQNELTDPQTGLASKTAFEQYFSEMREKSYKAVYYMAYIGFDIRKYTQAAGEKRADEIFLHAAEVLKQESQNDFACRYAGGAFLVIHVCASEKDAEKWIKPLLLKMNEEIYADKQDMVSLFRAGLLKLKSSDWVMESVCSLAEKSYRRAETSGQAYCIPESTEVKKTIVSKMLENKIDSAVQGDGIEIFLQPLVDTQTHQVRGFEALSRWNDPEFGLIGPGRYIDILSEKGKIREHDLKLLEKVVTTLEKWQKEGKPYWISSNLTRETISSETLLDEIRKVVEGHEFDHNLLTLEITEDSLVSQKDIARKNLETLRDMGFNISLDDLGSGYTFFSDLLDYPFTVAKMDRSLLLGSDTEKGKALMGGIIYTCKQLGMQIVCEGVETGYQMERVCELGADYIQGFYFYQPMTIGEAEKLLEKPETMKKELQD